MRIFSICVIGKPNVGKSTFINTLTNRKVSIVSNKPQTTRNNITTLYSDGDFQLIIIDTPGYHFPKNKLDLFLNSQVKQSFKEVDGYLFIIDGSRNIDEEDFELYDKIKTFKEKPTIFAINKIDKLSNEEINKKMKEVELNFNSNNIVPISASMNLNINKIISKFKDMSYETDVILSYDDYEQDDKFLINEIIREQILKKFRQEIPHSVAVQTDNMIYDKEKNLLKIFSNIVVEKESQKPIIIGKGGSSIKEIGINSRKELLKIFDTKIHLELNVKVRKKWRDDNLIISSLGYKK